MPQVLRRFSHNRAALVAACVLAGIAALALFGPLFYPRDPFQVVAKPFQPPFGEFLLGTDVLGRDVAAGLAYGAARRC